MRSESVEVGLLAGPGVLAIGFCWYAHYYFYTCFGFGKPLAILVLESENQGGPAMGTTMTWYIKTTEGSSGII